MYEERKRQPYIFENEQEYRIFSKYHFTTKKEHIASKRMKDRLYAKFHDIERYIAANVYFSRDLMPHDGRYYNREKWLGKLGLWKYPIT